MFFVVVFVFSQSRVILRCSACCLPGFRRVFSEKNPHVAMCVCVCVKCPENTFSNQTGVYLFKVYEIKPLTPVSDLPRTWSSVISIHILLCNHTKTHNKNQAIAAYYFYIGIVYPKILLAFSDPPIIPNLFIYFFCGTRKKIFWWVW